MAEILAGADPTGLGIGGAASTLDARAAVRRLGRQVQHDERRRRTTATGSASAAASSRSATSGLIGLDAEAMSQDDPITSGLSSVNLGVAGYFELADGADGQADAA